MADRGASQTPVYESDFSAGVVGFVNRFRISLSGDIDSIGGEDDWLSATVGGASGGDTNARFRRPISSDTGRSIVEISGKILIPSTNSSDCRGVVLRLADGPDANTIRATLPSVVTSSLDVVVGFSVRTTSSVPATVSQLLVTLTNSGGGLGVAATNGDIVYLKDLVIKNVGLTSELIASNAQSDTGQIFDTSGNKNHALLPASGATVVGRPVSQTREVRWTNTWDGTNELQYIGGVNQAILPANAYIESIIGTVSGATPHDIIVGDGSDTDRYVTITTGLAAGTTTFALASRTTDGTNLKLTVDPDTNADMSIAWVISYRILE
jgi:hypothetical protein